MLLAPAVVANLLANPDVAVNLESVLRRVMPLDWRAYWAVFAGRDLTPLDLYDPVGSRRCERSRGESDDFQQIAAGGAGYNCKFVLPVRGRNNGIESKQVGEGNP